MFSTITLYVENVVPFHFLFSSYASGVTLNFNLYSFFRWHDARQNDGSITFLLSALYFAEIKIFRLFTKR